MKFRACTLALVLAACSRAPLPATAPAPVAEAPRDARSSDSIQTEPAVVAVAPDTVTLSPVEIERQAVSVFGDSSLLGVPVAAPAPDSAATPDSDSLDVDESSWDMDVRSYQTHARVEHFVSVYSGPARESIQRSLERGTRYDSMIRAKFRAGGLPEDMSYLALIESGYDPNAYSRAAAVGMWQFMSSTGRAVGLRIDWWVDERRDPVRSTDGAIRFINDLREQFGSLYLAAAAYNGGPGRISRGLTRFADDMGDVTGEDRFFALAEENYLPRETKNYVPQLIAAAIVGKHPERYGLRVRPLAALAYDSVRVGPSVPLAAVAAASGAPVSAIRDLNPHVLRGTTPPAGQLWLRIPVGAGAGFDTALAALPPGDRTAFRRVETKKGDTMGKVAVRYDLSARELEWYNPKAPLLKSGRLRPGQLLLVPTRAVASAAFPVPDPSIERYGSSSRRGRVVTHVVRRGESLGSLSRKYRTSVATLKRMNRLRKTVIYPGQTIIVRQSPSRSTARPRGVKAGSSKASRRSTARKSSTASGSPSKKRPAPVKKPAASNR